MNRRTQLARTDADNSTAGAAASPLGEKIDRTLVERSSAPPTFASRRRFLRIGGGLVAGAALGMNGWPSSSDGRSSIAGAGGVGFHGTALQAADDAGKPARRPRIAAINSIYRLRSHAYHIVGRFVHGYERNGLFHKPIPQVVRLQNDQSPADDLTDIDCPKYGIQKCATVAEALGGAKSLDVDAVLLIIEHGDYPVNKRGQVEYPRFEKFMEIADVFAKSGRSVPVFVDKHLSYDYEKARKMVQVARDLKFPLMAGSSLPVTWRRPEIEPPLGTPFTEAVCTFGFDRAAPEIYLFHALEVLQSMLERRPGGESGVKSVECLKGDAVWAAGDAGRWSWKLLEAAVARCPSRNIGSVKDNVLNPMAILVEYQDGTRGAVLNLIEQVSEFAFAGFVKGTPEPISSCFYLPAPPGARFFDPLCWNIERFFMEGKSPYPVERTLMTSTVLDFAHRSLEQGGKPVSDPALLIKYAAPADSGFFRGGLPGLG